MTGYKQLCAELVEIWDNTSDFDYNDFGNAAKDLVIRARAALAEPEPEGPTNEELNALWNCCGIADEYGHHKGNFFDFARAVLARWGK